MHQFQTAERILTPDWAEKFSASLSAPGSPRMVYTLLQSSFKRLFHYYDQGMIIPLIEL